MNRLPRTTTLSDRQIILRKLTYLHENAPTVSGQRETPAERSEQRRWLSEVGALLKRLDSVYLGTRFDTYLGSFWQYPTAVVNWVLDLAVDAIERIKLDLELDSRNDVGTAYAPGEAYRYFADLKQIMNGAGEEIFLIDPYFDGAAFHDYLGSSHVRVSIRILAGRYASEVASYASQHSREFASEVKVRQSKELHDRVIFVDRDGCWVSGGSIKDAGSKPTYLVPLAPEIAEAKLRTYEQTWKLASVLSEPKPK